MLSTMNAVIYSLAIIPIFIASIYAAFHVITKHEKRHHIRHVMIITWTALFSFFCAVFLKNTIAHPRPDLTQALFMPNDPYSFPSGHATFMFALAYAMYTFDKRAGIVLFAFAILTGVARVLAGVHFWYDIIGGACVGVFVACISVFFINYFSRK